MLILQNEDDVMSDLLTIRTHMEYILDVILEEEGINSYRIPNPEDIMNFIRLFVSENNFEYFQ